MSWIDAKFATSAFDKRRYAALVTAHARVEAALLLVDCNIVDAVCDHDEKDELETACAVLRLLRHKLAGRL